MPVRMFFGVFAALAATSALGQETNPCHQAADDAARLSCYDAASGYTAPSVEPEADVADSSRGEGGGQWLLQEDTSAIDSRRDVFLSVMSQNTQPGTLGRHASARLYVRCMENSTNVFITFNAYTSDDQRVRYRVDDRTVASVYMEPMRGGEGIGIWSGGRAIPFARELFGANTLIVEYDTYERNGLEFEFDVSGLRQRIEPLAAACNWVP